MADDSDAEFKERLVADLASLRAELTEALQTRSRIERSMESGLSELEASLTKHLERLHEEKHRYLIELVRYLLIGAGSSAGLVISQISQETTSTAAGLYLTALAAFAAAIGCSVKAIRLRIDAAEDFQNATGNELNAARRTRREFLNSDRTLEERSTAASSALIERPSLLPVRAKSDQSLLDSGLWIDRGLISLLLGASTSLFGFYLSI
jgi:hypothetical protein